VSRRFAPTAPSRAASRVASPAIRFQRDATVRREDRKVWEWL
jgi:hypothetical protein